MYTRKNLLCIHRRSLVHAQHSCACTTFLWPGTQKWRGPGPGTGPAPFLGPWRLQECCACTRDLLCIHKRFFRVYTINVMRNYVKLCETMRNYAKLCETMKIGRPIPSKCVYLHAPAHKKLPRGIHPRIPRIPRIRPKWRKVRRSQPHFPRRGSR